MHCLDIRRDFAVRELPDRCLVSFLPSGLPQQKSVPTLYCSRITEESCSGAIYFRGLCCNGSTSEIPDKREHGTSEGEDKV